MVSGNRCHFVEFFTLEKMAAKLADLEPRLIYPVKGFKDVIDLQIQPDEKGIKGDVRDVLALKILLKSEKIGWEIKPVLLTAGV